MRRSQLFVLVMSKTGTGLICDDEKVMIQRKFRVEPRVKLLFVELPCMFAKVLYTSPSPSRHCNTAPGKRLGQRQSQLYLNHSRFK